MSGITEFECSHLSAEGGDNEATAAQAQSGFVGLGLSAPVLRAIEEIGYEVPSPIQERTIPYLLSGRDVVGQAQTGTGKTGAFALPLLSRLNMDDKRNQVQVLVLVPTRELAIQVSEAFARYAVHIPGFQVLPIYGGTGYEPQLRHLRKGSQVVVGTPGRLADHLRRGTLKLDNLQAVVLDEADEMLRMGFIDEVEWILDRTPPGRQIALFSATMPERIRKIALNTLKDPIEITIRERTATAAAINQRYWLVSGMHKLDALTRLLEAEDFDAMIIFVRMKTAAAELARKLQARGLACEALSGDVPQREREAIVDRVRSGETDILVATDVAARGLDVPRISHVVNYDIPLDTESYIHRIGRTGRAGRTGVAILFVAPRERRMLLAIERATRQKISLMQMPTMDAIRDLRVTRFRQRILDVLAQEETLETYRTILEDLEREQGVEMADIAAACAYLAQGEGPSLVNLEKDAAPARQSAQQSPAPVRERAAEAQHQPGPNAPVYPQEQVGAVDAASVLEGIDHGEVESPRKSLMQRVGEQLESEAVSQKEVVYRLAVGHRDRVRPGMIVGAIANEAGIAGKSIGNIQIEFDHTLVVMPALTPGQEDMLQRTRVAGVPLKLERAPEGTVVKPFKPSIGGDSRPSSRGGYHGGGRKRVFERQDRFRDQDTGGFRGPRHRFEDQEFRRPAYDDRDRGDRRRDEGGSSAPFRGGRPGFGGGAPRRGFGAGGGGYSGPGGVSGQPYGRDEDDRPPFWKHRDNRPDDHRDRNEWQEERPRRDNRDSGGAPRRDFRPGGKSKPRFEPPWGFPKGHKPGKPKR